MAAFEQARRRDAPGVESDVRCSSDGVPVLSHDPAVGWRHRQVAETPAASLPPSIVRLSSFYTEFGAAFEVSLDVKTRDAFEPTVAAAAEVAGALERLWLCGGLDDVLEWRAADSRPKLVLSTRRNQLRRDFDGIAARLRDGGVNAVNLPARDWDRRTVDGVHACGLLAFGWDAHRVAAVRRLVALGCDGIYGDDVDALLAGAAVGPTR